MRFVVNHINERGYAPTLREIGKAVGLTSSSAVKAHVDVLARMGYLAHANSKARTLKPLKDAAGRPVTVRCEVVR